MKKQLWALGAAVFFVTTPAWADDVKQEGEKVIASYIECIAKHDPACVASLYSKEGVQLNPGGLVTDIKAAYETNFKNGEDHIETRLGHIWVLNNDLTVSEGETDIFGKNPKTGEATKTTVFWGATSIREDGELKIRMLTVGIKPPPAKEADAANK